MSNNKPDDAEEAQGKAEATAIPQRGLSELPIVGLGGSAGGVEALREFFSVASPTLGVAYVVIMHLSPYHDSVLADILQRCTAMPVIKVEKTVRVQANTVYVIPPGKSIETLDGHITLADQPLERHRLITVDIFFRTLAETHGPHAVAVVLSGADGDGAIGIKRIKERGGLTIVQDPEEAKVNGMPRSALATGMVDWEPPVAKMPERIEQYFAMERSVRLPAEAPASNESNPALSEKDEEALREILKYLRARTARDFTYYKRATVLRRIGRRMQVNGIMDMPAYLDCLRTRPGERTALVQDLLISVTNFFRDSDCFAALQERIPLLFEDKSTSDTVRVWVAGCATGEEAYSIAILLNEYAQTLDHPPSIKVFATDLDDDAIRVAREGLYPTAITGDVTEDRLRRFFVKDTAGYRVRRELRECILFAAHDVLRDSPFSKVDLVSCRNLLIYLNRDAQARVLDIFHFALVPGGTLFLGSSEFIDENTHQFSIIDKAHRLFAQQHLRRGEDSVRAGLNSVTLALHAQARSIAESAVSSLETSMRSGQDFSRSKVDLGGRAVTWSEIHLKLLERIAPPSILVDSEHEVLHMSPNAGRFLTVGGGEPTRNLLKLIHPAMSIELRAAIYAATNSGATASVPPVQLQVGAEPMLVALDVHPMAHIAPGLLLVVIRSESGTAISDATSASGDWIEPAADLVADQLDREISRLKSHLRETVEQYETSTEGLRASNEELQAMNEELRSATEELETSREELQSINEELTTVNHELKSKVEQLGHANSDIQNLMDATEIPTVFLDRQLRITRYTPSALALFNFIASDLGRPLVHLNTQLNYPEMLEDATLVFNRLAPVKRQIGHSSGKSYLVRLLPYRTVDDRIAGVVLTFVDITERLQDAEALRQSEDRFSAIVGQATVGVVQAELNGNITFANKHYAQLLGYEMAELIGKQLLELVHPEDRAQSAEKFARLGTQGETFQIEKRCIRKDGTTTWLHNSAGYLEDAKGNPSAAIIVCTDITERKHVEAAARESAEWLRLMIENAIEYGIFSMDLDRRITTWNSGAERLLGYTEEEAIDLVGDIIFTDEDRAREAPIAEAQTALAKGHANDERWHLRKDGSQFWASGAMMPMRDAAGDAVGLLKIMRDQTEQRASQEALLRSRGELLEALQDNENARSALQAADEVKDRFLAVLSHELRNPLASISSASMALGTGRLTAEDQERAAEIVQRQAQVMKVLLDDLLDISRLRMGKLVLAPTTLTLGEIFDSALESTRSLIRAANHRLEVVLPDEPILVHADPVRFAQVISNLLINATKYTPDGGDIELRASTREGMVSVSVTDSGIGMEPARIEAMFEMFSQDGNSGGRGQSGLGIGLALVRNIVELHHGKVSGESAGPGMGSTFTVTLPVAAPVSGMSEEKVTFVPPSSNVKVLIVDDNPDVVWTVAQLLKGFEVLSAGSGQQALALLQKHHVDVAVLDLGLPDMSGLEVAKSIRGEPWGKTMLLIAATGWGQQSDRFEAKQAGFDEHLVKPLNIQQLLELISHHQSTHG